MSRKKGHSQNTNSNKNSHSIENSKVRSSINSLSQIALDEIIQYPRIVPEKLDFKQLEKFEGIKFETFHKILNILQTIILHLLF